MNNDGQWNEDLHCDPEIKQYSLPSGMSRLSKEERINFKHLRIKTMLICVFDINWIIHDKV
jgi:hypothetical protein